MARLSLRLPDTLHQQLTLKARLEGVSLNQYLVFLLAQRSAPAYSVFPSAKSPQEQRASFAKLREELGSASADEVRKFLDERDPVEPEPEWTSELRERFERQLARARASTSE